MMALEPLRQLCAKALVELRCRVSLHDGETADKLRGADGEKRIARMVGDMLRELADHETQLAPDARRSHTLASIRKVPGVRQKVPA